MRREPNELDLDGLIVPLEHPIADTINYNDRVVVLFDPGLNAIGQFPNLVAVDRRGSRLWTAELPTNQSADTYTLIEPHDAASLRAYSFCGHLSTVALATGKILTSVFTK